MWYYQISSLNEAAVSVARCGARVFRAGMRLRFHQISFRLSTQHVSAMPRYARTFAVVQLCLIFVLGAAQTCCAQERTRFLHWMYQDVGALARTTVSPETPFVIAGGAAAIFYVSHADDPLADDITNIDEGEFHGFFNAVNELGGSKVVYPAAGIFATSLFVDDPRFQDAAFTSLQSLMYSKLLVSGIKSVAGRLRPYRGKGPYEFEPFSGHTSFPSGHTASAVALTVPWAVYYPNVATFGLVGASVGTAVARMAREKHWLTDVVTGGTIAGLIGYWLARRHQNRTDDYDLLPKNVSVVPTMRQGGVLVSVNIGL